MAVARKTRKVQKHPLVAPPRGKPPPMRSTKLENAKHELFCIYLIRNGFKRAQAHAEAFGQAKTPKNNQARATAILKLPEVQARLRYLLREQTESRVTTDAIQKDAIEGRMWEVIERCMENKRVAVPAHLKGRAFRSCTACRNKEPSAWCRSCKHNQKLLADWEEFGGIYKFDARGAINALLPLGRDRGVFIDRKLIGHMEGDEIIDAMSDAEVRELVRSLAGEVGLRVVEAGSEGAPGAEAKPGPELPSVH